MDSWSDNVEKNLCDVYTWVYDQTEIFSLLSKENTVKSYCMVTNITLKKKKKKRGVYPHDRMNTRQALKAMLLDVWVVV